MVGWKITWLTLLILWSKTLNSAAWHSFAVSPAICHTFLLPPPATWRLRDAEGDEAVVATPGLSSSILSTSVLTTATAGAPERALDTARAEVADAREDRTVHSVGHRAHK